VTAGVLKRLGRLERLLASPEFDPVAHMTNVELVACVREHMEPFARDGRDAESRALAAEAVRLLDLGSIAQALEVCRQWEAREGLS
jgi:hypothetical protein